MDDKKQCVYCLRKREKRFMQRWSGCGGFCCFECKSRLSCDKAAKKKDLSILR